MESRIICGVPTVDFKGAVIISKAEKVIADGNANRFDIHDYTFISTYEAKFLDKIKLTFKMAYKLWS